MWLLLFVWITVNPITLQQIEEDGFVLSRHLTLGNSIPLIVDRDNVAIQPDSDAGCLAWRDYVRYEMARAYPNEQNFRIVCRSVSKTQT